MRKPKTVKGKRKLKTNRAVKVSNLKIGKAVKSVRVALAA